MKFGTKLDSDELYCVTNNQLHVTYLFVHFSFSPMEISVTDFSAPIGASVLKLCVHLQEGKVHCVNRNSDANPHFAFFFIFSFFLLSLLYNTYGYFFLSKISQQLLELGF